MESESHAIWYKSRGPHATLIRCKVICPKYYKHSNESDTFPFLGRFGRQESTENFYKVSIFGSFPFKFLWTKQIQE